MNRCSLSALLFAATIVGNAYAATGNLVVFDDADQNGFNHAAANCSTNSFFGETTTVYSGTAAVAISKMQDNNGAGWAAPVAYSASSDYDGVTFWVNSGNSPSTLTSLAVYDASFNPHFMHLEDQYGGPLPAATWIQFHVPFSSPLFAAALSTSPDTVQTICVITHSPSGSGSDYLYLDQVSLSGADIFKNGFDN